MTKESQEIDGRRRQELVCRGLSEADIETLFEYGKHPYSLGVLPRSITFPMPDEPHVEAWRVYKSTPAEELFGQLQEFLPQLSIPIREGMSLTDPYANVMRRGNPFAIEAFGERLALREPTLLKLEIRQHIAGALPVLSTSNRSDFENLVRATVGRSEPLLVGRAINAQFVTGMTNWTRVQRYRDAFVAQSPMGHRVWPLEMKRVASQEKWRFQDRVLILCEAPYSSLSADAIDLDMTEEQWLVASTELRCEHEFIHYLTTRLFGISRLHLHDEVVCDWAGLVASLHDFRGAWLKAFLGLGADATLKDDSRFLAYCQGVTGSALQGLAGLVIAAIDGLEQLHQEHYAESENMQFLLTILGMSLEELASAGAMDRFLTLKARVQEQLTVG